MSGEALRPEASLSPPEPGGDATQSPRGFPLIPGPGGAARTSTALQHPLPASPSTPPPGIPPSQPTASSPPAAAHLRLPPLAPTAGSKDPNPQPPLQAGHPRPRGLLPQSDAPTHSDPPPTLTLERRRRPPAAPAWASRAGGGSLGLAAFNGPPSAWEGGRQNGGPGSGRSPPRGPAAEGYTEWGKRPLKAWSCSRHTAPRGGTNRYRGTGQ